MNRFPTEASKALRLKEQVTVTLSVFAGGLISNPLLKHQIRREHLNAKGWKVRIGKMH